ncbi:hypothetical protein [Halorubrum lipolyticum]|uniref:Uncharacterized protein n=1 Tax=Halorubrum lipolyticum DSM 21995 TaxID=1227482 RepID=M0NMD4_9EURY|nr:hypothetical protein [Halorubrum lipolyticum]EMA58319.1 hypothetical protein C469_13955 [Halorubrum lipolyticum DSM 21995]
MSAVTRSPPARVSALRTLSLVLAFAAAVGLIFGTAGFTAMSADRGVTANVTDDEGAYLGYAPAADEVNGGESAAVVEYRNQFATDLDEFDVDVSIADRGSTDATLESVETPSSLDRGGVAAVDVTLRCSEGETVPLLFEADGSGSGVSVSLDRTHTVTCESGEPNVTGVRYTGVGNAFVDADDRDGTVEAVVWLTDAEPGADGSEGTLRAEAVSTLNTSAPVRPQLPSNASDERMAAIEFPEQGIAFFHPNWNGENHASPGAGSGVGFADVPLDAETVSNTSVVDEQDD